MDSQEAVVCHGCVDDQYLKALIKNEGASAKCFYCRKKRKAITVALLSDLVAEVLYTYYKDTSAYDKGDDLNFHVTDILGCDDTVHPLVGDVCGELVTCSDWDAMQGGESRFDEFSLYSFRQLRPKEAERKWHDFKTGIMHKSRFFNQNGKEFLEWLFCDINSYQSYPTLNSKHDSVVRVMSAVDHIELFRARQCDSQKDLVDILKTPAKQLAAPPNELASNGRMNPEGVPVFYGAFDRKTCVAELRPPVGGRVISGQFRLTRDVRVLDFKRLEDSYLHEPLSMLDPGYRLKHERRKFLRTFHEKISSPVLPKQEREYLTTQVIAEYLSTQHTPRIDGVIFSSAQRKGGLNIVLFAHVVSVEHPGSVIAPIADQSVQTSGIEYVPDSLVVHKIEALEFHHPNDMKVDDGELEWSTEDPDFDDDWDW